MEFQAIYDIEARIKELLKQVNIKYTRLKLPKPFEYYMFEHIKTKGKNRGQEGYYWCGGRCRWGTTKKLQVFNRHCKDAFQLVGIAFDEPHRIKNEPNKIYPLVDLK